MTKVEFFGTSELVTGFRISGHSGYADEGFDIVCSAVSSATYMTANTITEIIKATPEIEENDGELYLKLDETDAQKCAQVMQGFVLHIRSLCEQYPKYITVTISEV